MFTGHSVLSFTWALSTGARPNYRHSARLLLELVMEKLLVHATTVGTAGNQLVIHGLSKSGRRRGSCYRGFLLRFFEVINFERIKRLGGKKLRAAPLSGERAPIAPWHVTHHGPALITQRHVSPHRICFSVSLLLSYIFGFVCSTLANTPYHKNSS